MQSFVELKQRLNQRLNIDSWKVARTMQDGVLQLLGNSDRLVRMGKDIILRLEMIDNLRAFM